MVWSEVFLEVREQSLDEQLPIVVVVVVVIIIFVVVIVVIVTF